MKLRQQSLHHEIVVSERAGVRTLRFGDTIQSTMRVGDEESSGLEYVDFFHLPFILRPRVSSVLFLGLGAATGPKQFLRDYPDVVLDVVELDESVVKIAKECFDFTFDPGQCRVHIADGGEFVAGRSAEWDVIIADAYSTEDGELVVPHEMMSERFFDHCRKALRSDGILIFNCAAGKEDELTRDVVAATSSFSHRLMFKVGNARNVVLLASAAPMEARAPKLAEMTRQALQDGRVRRELLLRRVRQQVSV